MGEQELSKDVGEIKGLLQGIQSMMATQSESINRRVDDMHHSISRRVEDMHTAVSRRLDGHQTQIDAAAAKADQALTMASDAKASARVATSAVSELRRDARSGSLKAGGAAGGLITAGMELLKHFLGG
jgi:hypothetical protein